MSSRSTHFYDFGPFRLDPAERILLREGRPVRLTPKAFEALVMLVERSGRLVERAELMRALWPDVIVEDGNVDNCVHKLRKAMGDGQSYIETVPKHGYRFVAEVSSLPRVDEEVSVERRTLTRTVTEEEVQIEDDAGSPARRLLAARSGAARGARRALPLVIALSAVLAVAALVLLYRPSATTGGARQAAAAATAPHPPRTIAVLPFKPIGAGVSDEEYLGLGMTDALITRLGNVRQLIVRPTSAVRLYTDANQDPVAAGRQQGVEAVLDGSFRRTGDRLRLTAQLIRVADGATLWSAQFDERFTNIFSVQDSISERVACDLVTHICGAESGRLIKQRKVGVEAYQAYLKGRHFWNKRTRDGYQRAIGYFKQAIEIDPSYAQAYAGLADAILYRGGDNLAEQNEAFAEGRAALQKAIEIDETLAEPHATLGLLAMNVDWDWAGAEKQFRRSIELNPNYATAHQWYGEFLAYMGRFDEAVTEIKRAQELDPLSLIISTDVAKIYSLARRYDEAIESYQRALEIDPEFAEAHGLLAMTYSMRGRHEEAERELLRIRGLEDSPMYLSWLAYVYGAAGRRDEAQRALSQLGDLSKRTYVSPFWLATAYTGLGEKEQAFRWFERVFQERAPVGTISLKVNPIWDSLRPDPRYDKLLRRAGFAP